MCFSDIITALEVMCVDGVKPWPTHTAAGYPMGSCIYFSPIRWAADAVHHGLVSCTSEGKSCFPQQQRVIGNKEEPSIYYQR